MYFRSNILMKMQSSWTSCIMVSLSIALLSVTCLSSVEGRRLRDHVDNVTQTIEDLLHNYDVRLRPNFGGEPCYIEMDIMIASFDAISEVDMDFTVTMYLNQYWIDERLAFSSSDQFITMPADFADNIWVPDTFFANDKNSYMHDVTERNTMIRIHGDGAITYGMRFTTTLVCLMDLHYYPLDIQNCTLEIKSYGYTVTDIVMVWKEIAVVGVEEARLPQFTIKGYETTDRTEKLNTGVYRNLSIVFNLQRNIGYFIFQTYLPSILIVMLSWVSFWINHEAIPARVALGITTVLTMTSISTSVRDILPKISYVQAIDIYLVTSFGFVFAALLEYAAVNYIFWLQKKKVKKPPKEIPKPSPPSISIGNSASGAKVDGFAQHPEEIIDLQDIGMPQMNSVRRRYLSKLFPKRNSNKYQKSSPSYCTGRSYSFSGHPSKTQKNKVLIALKRRTTAIKHSIPSVTDVNIIDKYSRVFFPLSFLIFNTIYWIFYCI